MFPLILRSAKKSSPLECEGYLTRLKGCFTLVSRQRDWVISFFHFIRQVNIRFYALVYVFCNSSLAFKFEYNNKTVIFVLDVLNH